MSERTGVIGGLLAGLVLGAILGSGLAIRIEMTNDQWWSLAGSAGGALVAIGGAMIGFHYQAGATERVERRRVAEPLNQAIDLLKIAQRDLKVKGINAAPDAREDMERAVQAGQIATNLARELQSRSTAIAHAHRTLLEVPFNTVEGLATSAKAGWLEKAQNVIDYALPRLERARRELKI